MINTAADWALMIESDLREAIRHCPPLVLRSKSFWFLRHGRTSSNVSGLIQGQLDVALDDVGRQQAREAGQLLRDSGITQIVSSDLSRALDTASLVAAKIGGAAPRTDPRLRERGFGPLQGKISSQQAWLSSQDGVETNAAFAGRTLEGIAAAVAGADTLVCAHGGNLRVLVAALGLTLDEAFYANATPLQFSLTNGNWSCRRLQETESLD